MHGARLGPSFQGISALRRSSAIACCCYMAVGDRPRDRTRLVRRVHYWQLSPLILYGRAFGVLVLSFAGHCSESAGNAISLPVIRSTEIA